MLNFAQNLEQLIRTDIKEDNGKSDIILRSLSRAASYNGILPEDLDFGQNKMQKSISDTGPTFGARVNNINNTEVFMDVQENAQIAKFVEVP